jgi:hypothetical protein
MIKKKENNMMRFFLFVAVAWLFTRIVKFVFQIMSQRRRQQKKPDYGVGGKTTQSPEVEFKDVQEAQFEDITESKKEKAPK